MRISDWSSDVCSSDLQVRTMLIGLVVDSACDLPKEFIERHAIEILPIAVRIDGTTEVDYRDQAATLAFLDSHIAERGVNAETIQIGRAHDCTPVTNAQPVCRLPLEKKTKHPILLPYNKITHQ